MKKIIFVLLFGTAILSACEKDNLPDPGATVAVKVANEWWCTFTLNGEDVYGDGYHGKIATYNTSANDDSIWVDDFGTNIWAFKCKAKIDYSNLTFSAANSPNEYYGITVNINNGKILPGMGVSKTGNITDSITMDIEFEDDPGTIYTLSGHARTRFAEDDY
jgi:hypothetical protein